MKTKISTMEILKWIACLLLLSQHEVNSAKILSLTFFSSRSHKLTYMPLLEELGKRGHNVTILTPIRGTKELKNVKEILTLDWEVLEKKFQQDNKFDVFEMKKAGKQLNPFVMLEWFDEICKSSYDLDQVKNIMKEEFDLIFFQPFFNDCALGLIYRMKLPVVLFYPMSVAGFALEKVGGHLPPSFNPNLFLSYPMEMSFYQRFVNFGFNVMFEGILKFYYEPAMAKIYREKLGNDIPSVNEILADQTALLLSNGHFSLHKPKPYFPDVVDVGGIHSRPAKPLPKDLEDFIKKGKDGFIYFSMGSAIKGSQMPDEQRQKFLNVFSKLKQQVLWKWETETMNNVPPNVLLKKWLPQQDLLGHKDIKMFITHCGGGSTEEAIYHGTPLIGFPMFGDQPINAKLAKQHGFIVELDWNTATEKEISDAINEILNNPAYANNVKRVSTLYKDQPDQPMDRAVYWIEYVLRHKGAHHLRSVGRKLNFFQYHSYDVILAYLGLISLILYIIYAVLRFIARKLCGSSKKTDLNKKKQ